MANEKLCLEEQLSTLKKMLDKSQKKKCFVENAINKQKEELKEIEVLMERMQAAPMYLSRS